MKDSSVLEKYVKNFNGSRKVLILGNHDTYSMLDYYSAGLNEIYSSHRHKEFLLTHIPVHPDDGLDENRGWKYNIHGHLHYKDVNDYRYINVNIDQIGFYPIDIETIRDTIRYREKYRKYG